MKQFEKFVGKQVYLTTPRAKYIGTLEHEDRFFIYLADCVVLVRSKRKSPYAVVRKGQILEMRVIGGEANGYTKT
ncbi:hypothetical protein [Thermococcus thioreducens]|uniref:LSM domain-containing protein n=1 Tax=Thermococcus thioreducens TaxID=277988 RepID=A0A0Q2QSX4_9EURY|nr:hypothetical protein [Thermococcus thioreducens]ASJ12402.1 hypothetical protein A3L14_05625 [Thermococcus thioreducens]KQH83133.1 hypothetical protein AMR53_02630 [Thermococcus thioreducens]SEV91472.1 hypothetical protein SAMN05216170_0832 [Thermococcus thioreducens]